MTIKHRYNAAAAAGDAAAMEALLREMVAKAREPAPIAPTSIGRIDSKLAALLAEVEDDASDETVLSALDEKHRETIDKAAEAIAQEPVQAAVDAVRIAQYRVDAVARKYDPQLATVADELSPDDMNKHVRGELDERYDALLLERGNKIGKHRNAAVAAVVVERNKVIAERDALEASLAGGSDDPLVLVTARDTAVASVTDRLTAIDKQLQDAAFLVPSQGDSLGELTGGSAAQQRRLATLWAEETCAKYTGTNWMRFADETPQTQWLVPYIIPVGAATIIVGEGGVGKSRLALQLATAASLRDGLWPSDWIPAVDGGDSVGVRRTGRPAITMIVNAEDQPSDAARRIVKIRAGIAKAAGEPTPPDHMGTELAQGLARVLFYQSRGVVWGPSGSGSTHIETTAELSEVGRDVRAQCERMDVKLLVLDPLANLYGSSENTRTHVAAYMRSWNAWAQRTGIAVVMLCHPPKSGEGFSGSSSWVGASRAAIEFRRLEACMEGGRLRDAKVVRAERRGKGKPKSESPTDKPEPMPETVTLYQLVVTKINHAYRKTHWLAESGMAFVTGRQQDLFDMARRGKSVGATTQAGPERNPSQDDSNISLADMDFMK